MAEEEKDDWLADPEDGEELGAELDQSDIDALLSGDDDDAPAEAAESEDIGVELDQSDIDALLSDDDDVPAPAEAAEADEVELDQSDIDALLSSDSDDAEAAGDQESELESGDPELDQSDIDALLSGAEDGEGDAGDFEDPDQAEIDKLFSDVDEGGEEDPFQAEEVDFKDVIDESSSDEDSFGFDTEMSDFNAEEFELDDDIPDIPDLPDEKLDAETELLTNMEPAGSDVATEDETQFLDESELPSAGKKKFKMPEIPIPPMLQDRKVQSISGAVLLLLIVVSFFLFSGGDEEVAQTPEETAPTEMAEQPATPAVAAKIEAPANAVPMVGSPIYEMPSGQSEMVVLLPAADSDGDPLQYEVLSQPQHGVLSGVAPNLVYRATPGYKGMDSFLFRVNDGKAFSETATIKISRSMAMAMRAEAGTGAGAAEPEELIEVPAEPKTIASRRLIISAEDRTYSLKSTDSLLIDWQTLWLAANYLPYTEDVRVDIVDSRLGGSLERLSGRRYRYYPDKYSGGNEYIRYRFRLGSHKSKIKRLNLRVALGSPAPEIHLEKLASSYRPGETVVIDASKSRDEKRDRLIFSWQQLAGIPIQLQVLNKEGSKVGFIVPSAFNTVADPGPLLRLTAVDETGKQDSKDIKITTSTSRPPALWGSVGSVARANGPLSGY